jgi:hypothetical protein
LQTSDADPCISSRPTAPQWAGFDHAAGEPDFTVLSAFFLSLFAAAFVIAGSRR